MKVVAIVQARMGSTRLHGKMLLDLAGATLIERVIERVYRATRVTEVALAVPYGDLDAFVDLNPPCQIHNPKLDDADLVGRYREVAEMCRADLIVRIPGDNPCVQADIIDEAIDHYLSVPSLYVSTLYWHLRDRVYVDGLGAEVCSLSRLQWLDQKTQGQPTYREHPHLYFQDHHLIDGWEQYQRYANVRETIRLDVNTQADYEFIADLYQALWPANHNFTISDILAYLERKSVRAVMMYDGPITVQEG